MTELVLAPTDFVALTNQVLDRAFPRVTIEGELSDFRVSKNRWVYFNLKDAISSVKFFGTVYMLPGPLEDGMRLKVAGRPQLHPQFGFSVTIQTITPSGVGSIKKAFDLLQAKLTAEGLFEPERKRSLPYPPQTIGLITSGQSAAYADFIKIINERWSGVEISLADVQVQGEAAVGQIVQAIDWFNTQSSPLPDVLVITRGGGSLDDLAVFNTEQVTRAVAGSRVPTLVAIGHEVDISLAELAADQRASTPSNGAQLLVPDRRSEIANLNQARLRLTDYAKQTILGEAKNQAGRRSDLILAMEHLIHDNRQKMNDHKRLLAALNPGAVLKRGYAIVRSGGAVISSGKNLQPGQDVSLELRDAVVATKISAVELK